MDDVSLRLEHAIDADATLSFAWRFRTDVSTWDDPPATFSIDGPFVVGAHGVTTMPGQPAVRWRVGDVRFEESFVIDIKLDGAKIAFTWMFAESCVGSTRLTQRIELSGTNAGAYAELVRAGFGSTLRDGMERIGRRIGQAFAVHLIIDNLDGFVERFAACTLRREEWTHEAHLAVGSWHVDRYGADEALTRLRAGIRRLNESLGGANTETAGYHETITCAYVRLLAECLARYPAGLPLAERVADILAGPMADRHILDRFYSRDRLMSALGRAEWIEPDVAPLDIATVFCDM
jgi:hypothetical protein